MMKKIIFVMLVLMFVAAGTSFALPVDVNDTVKFIDYDTDYVGHYKFENVTDVTSFSTFCLEKNEYISYGGTYTVASISKTAYAGGNNITSGTDGDEISAATQWLYSQFLGGTLSVSGVTNFNDLTGINALQDAFWDLEEEIDSVSGLASDLVAAANDAVEGGDADLGNVWVMNIVTSSGGYAQSQLIGAPVPEPATLILLGSGLAGLAFYRRKRK